MINKRTGLHVCVAYDEILVKLWCSFRGGGAEPPWLPVGCATACFGRHYCTDISDGRRWTLNESSAMSNGLCRQSADRRDDVADDLFIWTQRCSNTARRHCITFKSHLELYYYAMIQVSENNNILQSFTKFHGLIHFMENLGHNIFHGRLVIPWL